MANVILKFKGLDSLTKKKILTRKFLKKLGDRVVKDIKQSIAIGKSPVKGFGRFVAYKADRATSSLRKDLKSAGGESKKKLRTGLRKDIKRTASKKNLYPNSVKSEFPNKQRRPINLKLSGDLLKAIKFKPTKRGVRIGLISAKKKIKDIFTAHNEGSNTKKKVPRRAILPTGDGDKFTAVIQKRIRNLFLARIRQVLKTINKK